MDLDTKRHGKQRLEAYDIYGLNVDFINTHHTTKQQEYLKRRYGNHPAVKMWKDYIEILVIYYDFCILTWIEKKFKNNMPLLNYPYNPYLITIKEYIFDMGNKIKYPLWLTDSFCSAHRSNLLRKNYDFYGQYNWKEKDGNYKNVSYIWPI